MYNRFYILLLSFICFSWCACSSVARREAQHTISLADSLRAEGVPYDDSAAIAGSVATLNHYRLFLPTDYAKANYYYGRLLRSKEHYPEAMKCFIDASRSHSRDYRIMGRVYANMANMCQLEGNYDMAYNIYEQSKDYFRKANDSTLYYYAINNMAIQRAHLKDKKGTFNLLATIEQECAVPQVQTKTLETKAIVCRRVGEYDSAIYYVNLLQAQGNHEPTGYVIKAQAFWNINQYDSALTYAQVAMSHNCSLNDSINMLYVTSHDASIIDGDSILAITSERADKQFAYTFRQEQLSHAVELLQMNMIPDYKWVYGVIVTIIIIGIILLAILWSTKKYRAFQRSQLKHIKEQKALVEAEHNILVYQNNDLKDRSAKQRENIQTQFENNCIAFRNSQNLKKDLSWNNYDRMCEIVDERLFLLANKLKQQNMLTEKELRLCILEAIRIPQKQMAEILPYAPSGIGKFKYTTAKKLNVTSKNMRNFLIALAIGDEKIAISS